MASLAIVVSADNSSAASLTPNSSFVDIITNLVAPLFDPTPKPVKKCDKHKKERNLPEFTMLRGIFRGLFKGATYGLYHIDNDSEGVFDQRCLGEWMETSLDRPNKVMELANNGTFELISRDLTANATLDIVDLVYKNIEYCHFERYPTDLSTFTPVVDIGQSILKNVGPLM